MTMHKQEILLSKHAVALKIITKEQLDQCLDLQEQIHLPFAFILLKLKLTDEAGLQKLADSYFRHLSPESVDLGENLVLCRLIISYQLIKPQLLQQLVEFHKKNPAISLGRLVVEQKLIPIVKFFELYAQIPNATMSCPGCQKEFRLMSLTPGKKLRCKNCKTIFEVPSIEEEVGQYLGCPTKLKQEEMFAGYEILEEIAQGGMGIIYRVQKRSTGQIMALKVLREKLRQSEEAKHRFSREAKALSKLKHPNIVSIVDIGIENEVPYFTMDFIDGKPLTEFTTNQRLSVLQIIDLIIKICDGLEHAHQMGIIHRDIKPSNILLDQNGEPHITDFGLAKCMENASMVTRSNTTLGTAYYMPPEQARGQTGLIGPRSDIYAIGVVFYELLTSKNPFQGQNTVEIYHKILTVEPTPPSSMNKEINKMLDTICMKCLKKDPFQRYQHAKDVCDALRKFKDGKQSWWSRLWS